MGVLIYVDIKDVDTMDKDFSDSFDDFLLYGMTAFYIDENTSNFRRIPPHTKEFDKLMFRDPWSQDFITEDIELNADVIEEYYKHLNIDGSE